MRIDTDTEKFPLLFSYPFRFAILRSVKKKKNRIVFNPIGIELIKIEEYLVHRDIVNIKASNRNRQQYAIHFE